MRQPLPLACRSAFAWLNADAEQAKAAAERVYHGDGFMFSGEVDGDAYLARQFPEFQQLQTEPGADFGFWLDKLYRPLWAQCNQANAAGEAA
jgi:exodeoxyribonuclease V gamma subunit